MCSAASDTIFSAIDKNRSELHSLSKYLWENPELGFEEVKAHAAVTDFLEKQGFEVTREFKLPTAFRAEFARGEGPNVAIICEYDALPEIGHACGHNLICEAGLAASLGVKAALEAGKVNGKLMVFGTPAEERCGGKIQMIAADAFSLVDAAMMAHPFVTSILKDLYLAIDQLTVKFHGKAAHAAAAPWEGRNALDAAVACYNNMSLLRQQVKPKCRIHAIITNGGVRPNIIPAETEMLIYVRAPNQTELMLLSQRVVQCIIGAAKATDCEAEYEFSPKGYASMNHNTVMASVYQKHAEELGTVFISAPEGRPGGSTDMGNVSQVVPSIHPTFYIGTDSQIHTTAFRDQAGTDDAQEYTMVAAKALACTAVEILSDSVLLQQIRREFDETHESVTSLSEDRKASTQSV